MNSKYLISLCLSTLLLTSCNEDKKLSTLNESELFFEETLSSISKDGIDENIFYVGTEDGTVYIYNSDNQHLEKITTDFDRIYKVVRDTITDKEPVYWVGTRNMGLFRCELKNNSFVMKEKNGRFYIPTAGKATKYSAYDISIQKSGVYVATSHGLLKVPKRTDENDSTLIILSPESYKEKPDSLRPVVAGNLQQYKDQYLFCASDSGLLRVELSSDRLDKFFPQKDIKNVVIRNDSIYSLIGNSVIVTDYKGEGEKSFELKLPAQLYYYDETTQINYFISNHTIQLVKDADLYNPDKYKQVQTRRSIRTKCHNVIVNDLLHRQSLLVTIHSITRVGHHQDVFNSYGNVKLACTDNDNVYYLIDTKIYRQKKNEIKAYPFKDITKGTKDIRFMEVLNDELYYVDSNHEIYKANLYSNYFFNSIFSWDEHIKQDPDKKKDVTAIGKDKNNIYVGVRDGFRNLNDIDKDIPLRESSTNVTIPDPFITKFVSDGGKTLFCTLNDGIFSGKDNSFTRIPGSNSYTFIRDMGIDSRMKNRLFLLTNHGFLQQEDSAFKKNVDLSGYNRLLVLDSTHVFGVPNFGIKNLCDSMEYFVDIQFNPMACLIVGNNIIAGSSNGVYVFSSNLSKKNGIVETAGTYYTIDFDEQDYFSRKNIIIFITILIAIIIGLWWSDRYRMSRHAIQTFKDGLILRLDELNTVREYLDIETTKDIDGLVSEVEGVDVSGKKKALANLRDISLRIMEITGRAPSMLIQILQDQISQIKKSGFNDAQNLIDKTNEAIKNHTLLRLGEQIRKNSRWLSESQSVLSKLSNYKSLFSNLPIIPGVTDEISKVLKLAKSPSEQVLLIEELAGGINDATSKDKIKKYIETKIEECSSAQLYFEEETEFYSTLDLIKEDYYGVINSMTSAHDMTEVMKLIPAIDRNLSIFLILKNIRTLLPEYNEANSDYEKKHKENDTRKKEGFYVLKDESIRDKDDAEEKKRLERCTIVSTEITKNIDVLYKKFARGSEMDLLKTLEISIKESEGRQFMQANLLALLMTGVDIPVSRYKNLFGVNDQSLRRARRDLAKQLESHRQDIIDYAERNKTSIAILLLKLLDSSTNE